MKLNIAPNNLENQDSVTNNHILFKLEQDGFITPDEKAKELIKELTEIESLYALKLLFENQQNKFSPQVLINSLEILIDPKPFNYYSKESITRLEFHLRTWVAVLEQICFSQIVLNKELRDNVYNSLAKFAEIHRKTTQVTEDGLDNSLKPNFNPSSQQKVNDNDKNILKRRNYNVDFLLIHLRDTIHSLRDDETWFQEILRRTKDLLKLALNITPGILSFAGIVVPNDDGSILSVFTQLRQSFSFKFPVASYYVDWRIMLIIQHNLFSWSKSDERIISKKFGEKVLMECLWSYSEREWNNVVDKTMLDSQTKFEEVLNKLAKVLRNTGSFLNELAGNEPLALPDILWFGILDLAQNLIQKSTQPVIYGVCYYLNHSIKHQAVSFNIKQLKYYYNYRILVMNHFQ